MFVCVRAQAHKHVHGCGACGACSMCVRACFCMSTISEQFRCCVSATITVILCQCNLNLRRRRAPTRHLLPRSSWVAQPRTDPAPALTPVSHVARTCPLLLHQPWRRSLHYRRNTQDTALEVEDTPLGAENTPLENTSLVLASAAAELNG